MREALTLAERGRGWTQPNPCVGAVIVHGGKKLGEGWHRRAGGSHAEIEAIHDAEKKGHAVKGATIYVTLEPCSTFGRTPPCTNTIIARKFKRVVVGATDPNPVHAGRAYRILKKAGVAVTRGVLRKECEEANAAFNHWVKTGLPWVVVKVAMTLDGFLRMPKRSWLTGSAADKDVHRLRAICGAILVGAETLRTDNPQLTVRGVKCLRQPWRVVVTRSGKLPKEAKIFTDACKDRTLVFKNQNWKKVLSELGKLGVKRLLVEGGGKTIESLVKAKFVNEVWIYYAPFVSGLKKSALPRADVLRKLKLKNINLIFLGKDLKMTGVVV